LILVIKTKSNN